MNQHRTCWRIAVLALAAVVLLILAAPASTAQQSFSIIPPDSAVAATGMSYGEWSAVWWQHVVAKTVSDPNNPILEQTGKGCAIDQPRSSPVFFLFGYSGSGTVERNECTVPTGKVLFFPLMNAYDFHVPGDGLDTPELARQDLLKWFGPVAELHASIDGVSVGYIDPQTTPYRTCAGGAPECSAAFSITVPGNNIFVGSPAGQGRGGKPWLRAGVYSPTVADGYYLMVAPLSPGRHQINFGGSGSFGGAPWTQEITYNLVVK